MTISLGGKSRHADRWAHVQFTAEENLTEGDKDFRYWTLMQFMLHAETYFYHHEMDMMPESHWRGYEGYFMENIIRSRGFDEFWAQTGPGWSENFRQWVDGKVSRK